MSTAADFTLCAPHGRVENEDADPVGDGHADADMAATQPPEPARPNPEPDVPASPLDDEPGERPDEPGEHRARQPGKGAMLLQRGLPVASAVVHRSARV